MRIIKKQNDKKQERELKLLILFLTLLLVTGTFIELKQRKIRGNIITLTCFASQKSRIKAGSNII